MTTQILNRIAKSHLWVRYDFNTKAADRLSPPPTSPQLPLLGYYSPHSECVRRNVVRKTFSVFSGKYNTLPNAHTNEQRTSYVVEYKWLYGSSKNHARNHTFNVNVHSVLLFNLAIVFQQSAEAKI